MVRHASLSSAILAASVYVQSPATVSGLVAPPGLPTPLTPCVLSAAPEAVNLTAIASTADKNLDAATRAQK
jgi:hypothetical protein